MRFLSMEKDRRAASKTLAGLFVNMAAAWYGVIVVSPNFLPVKGFKEVLFLISDFVLGTICLWLSFRFERKLL